MAAAAEPGPCEQQRVLGLEGQLVHAGDGLALVRAAVQLGAVGHGGQEGHVVVVERGAPLAQRGVDCVEDVAGVAEGGGL